MTLGKSIAAACLGSALLATSPALADGTIRSPGAHRDYSFEIEPQFVFGDWGYYGGGYGGLGVRVSIPVVKNGFVPTINNSVAIGFGFDYLSWECSGCGVSAVEIPVVMQWNFYLHHDWSLFAEPGVVIYHGWWADCPGCGPASSLWPALYVGGRWHASDSVAITARLGFPEATLGVSFFP